MLGVGSKFLFAQTTSKIQHHDASGIDTSKYENFKTTYPITRDSSNAFPEILLIEGEIADYITGATCGVFCGCGAIKIKLTRPNAKYPYEYIFLGMPCFDKFPASLNFKTKWELTKIPLNDNSCYWTETVVNKFDSKGLPFYTMSN